MLVVVAAIIVIIKIIIINVVAVVLMMMMFVMTRKGKQNVCIKSSDTPKDIVSGWLGCVKVVMMTCFFMGVFVCSCWLKTGALS